MALIRHFSRQNRDGYRLHDEIDASYYVFEGGGRILLQIDTHGRASREKPGKQSQTIQLDELGARQLFEILKREFRFE